MKKYAAIFVKKQIVISLAGKHAGITREDGSWIEAKDWFIKEIKLGQTTKDVKTID